MKLSIYVCHQEASHFLTGNCFFPIHAGKAGSFNDIGCFGDNTGDSISLRHPFYGDLTAQYWIWKNDRDSDVIGLMHARGHLSFTDSTANTHDEYQQKHGLSNESIREFMGEADIICPKNIDLSATNASNNYKHYTAGSNATTQTLDKALAILREKYPEFANAAEAYNNARHTYPAHGFIMKRATFNAYSQWLFSILFELENHIDLRGTARDNQALFRDVATYLFGIYITQLLDEGTLHVKQADTITPPEGEYNGHLAPAFESNNVPIVVCFDDNYAHAGGALIQSILAHAQQDKNYDILVFEDGISQTNKSHLDALTRAYPNCQLRFFDVNTFSEMAHVHVRGHFSPATYARLFIPTIFQEQDKVVFIDCDTTVNDDLAKLLDYDLGDNLVAAVKDIVMEGFVRFEAPSNEHTGALPAGRYLSEYLGLENPDGYFQAGLIVFNLEAMRRENTYQKLMDTMRRKAYWFLDQDIMNAVFQQRILYLPMEWNVVHGNNDTETFYPGLKFSTYIRYLEARKNPSMVHYAGPNKPWIIPTVDYANLYWQNLRATPWHEQQLNATKDSWPKVKKRKRTKEEAFRRYAQACLGGLLPVGTQRRNTVMRFYFFLISTGRKLRPKQTTAQ